MTTTSTLTTPARSGPHPPVRLTRRYLQIGLGVLWLLDAALQFQPYMFGTGFGRNMIAGVADGQPVWIASGVRWAAALTASQPVLTNAAFATIQLIIALTILYRRTARLGLAASIAWSLGVWYFGEALGGIASGQASLLSGAPGAVILYAVLAALAWPRGATVRHDGDSEPPNSRASVIGWVGLWLGGAILQLLPAQRSASAVADTIGSNSQSAAGAWLSQADRHIAAAVRQSGRLSLIAVVVLFTAIGITAIHDGWPRKISAVTGATVAAGIWLFGENLGGITTGQATDPNSGPLFALLAMSVLATARIHSGETSIRSRRHFARQLRRLPPNGTEFDEAVTSRPCGAGSALPLWSRVRGRSMSNWRRRYGQGDPPADGVCAATNCAFQANG